MSDTRTAQASQNRACPHGTSAKPARGATRQTWQQSSEVDAVAGKLFTRHGRRQKPVHGLRAEEGRFARICRRLILNVSIVIRKKTQTE